METHKVSFPGFLLLEKEVEGLLGSTVQSIERVSCKYNLHEPFLSALSNRISRQQSLVSMVSIGRDFEITSKRDVLAFRTLLQAEEVTMANLKIEGEIGEDGWKMVAAAILDFEKQVSKFFVLRWTFLKIFSPGILLDW